MGSARLTAPSAITSRSYATSSDASCVSTTTVRRSWSSAVARPSNSSERGHIILSGTTT